jgi:hypothetical protein
MVVPLTFWHKLNYFFLPKFWEIFNIYEEFLIKSKFAMSNLNRILARIMIQNFHSQVWIANLQRHSLQFEVVLGCFRILTKFSYWFSQWEPIDMVDNRMENQPLVLTWTITSCENRFFLFFILENWIGSFKELAYDFQ